MRYRSLGKTGEKVSVIGFGASPLGDLFRQADPAESTRAVHCAIERGVNYFDVSPFYGITLAEERLGEALDGKRSAVLLATKCGRYDFKGFDYSAARVRSSIDESLRRLRTDYVDVLQVHDVEFADLSRLVDETLPALRQVQQSGKTRFIGITGFSLKALCTLMERAEVDTVLSYCRCNLLVRDMDRRLTPLARQKNIGLVNASPLHMGLLTDRPIPAWHPAPPEVRKAARRVVELCNAEGLRPGDVALRFCLDHPHAATTLVGMSSVANVEANVRALSLTLASDLMGHIEAIVAPVLNTIWPSGRPENQDD